jgi:hypothetical protein
MRVLNKWLLPVAALAVSTNTGKFDARGKALVGALIILREGYEDFFRVRFLPDAAAAIETRDMPRLARVFLSFFEARFLTRAIELEDRRRDTARIPFDMFCMRWHETSGTATERARYVAQTEGGNYHNHLNRFYRYRSRIEESGPT